MEKFCYFGDNLSLYGGAYEVVSASKGNAWKKSRVLGGVLAGKHSEAAWQKYQYCVWPVLLHSSENWEFTAVVFIIANHEYFDIR